MKSKKIPKKNYIILFIMIIFVIAITFIIVKIGNVYNTQKLKKSYLSNYINKVELKDISNILTEPSSELFVFITKTNDENVYNLEKDIKKVIKKHNLRDNFIYIDYSNEKDLKKLNESLKTNIKKIPALIYYRDGKVAESIDSNEYFINVGNLEKILDEYEVE